MIAPCLFTFSAMFQREDVELMLKTQRDSFNDSVSHLLTSFQHKFDKVEKDLSESKLEIERLKGTNENLTGTISKLVQEIENLKPVLTNSEAIQQTTLSRVDYLEDQSRRNNLRFDGVQEDSGENWEQTTKKVQDLVREKIGIETPVVIERAHRVGQPNSPRPRTIVAKFLHFNDKQNIIRNSPKLKGSNIFVNEDLCLASQTKRREQLPKLREARSQGKIAYFVHTRLVIKDRPPVNRRPEENSTAPDAQERPDNLRTDPPPPSVKPKRNARGGRGGAR